MTTLIKNIQENWTNEENSYKVKRNQFRISTAIYCPQRVFFSKLFELPELQMQSPDVAVTFEPNLELQGRFAAGNACHSFVEQTLIKKGNYLIASEEKISKKFKDIEIIGHFDLLVLDPDHGLKTVDVKSAKPSAFAYKINKADCRHLKQANLYAYILNTSHFSILYVEKVDYYMVEHIYEQDSEQALIDLVLLNKIYSEVNEAAEYLKNGGSITGKEFPADREDWECGQCLHNNICKQRS